MTRTQDDFFALASPEPMSGCWIWANSLNAEGYGVTSVFGVWRRAYRVAYELFVGAIPVGMHLDHKCRVRACVNPAHLEPVSIVENGARGMSPHAENSRKTHCLRGHEFSPENTRMDGHGRRECVTCARRRSRESSRRDRQRKKFAAPVTKTAQEKGNLSIPATPQGVSR